MMKPEQVPTGVAAVFDAVWEMTRRTDKALAAALSAWPGMACKHYYNSLNDKPSHTEIILPLPPQENPDDKA